MTIHIHRDGVSLVLDDAGNHLPVIAYFGRELPVSDADVSGLHGWLIPAMVSDRTDTPPIRSIMPEASRGWLATPGLAGSFAGKHALTHFVIDEITAEPASVTVKAKDSRLSLRWHAEIVEGGLVRFQTTVTNESDAPYSLNSVDLSVPVSDDATELISLEGRHLRERHPQRHQFVTGHFAFESRRGRAGMQDSTVLMAGTPGFDFERGDVWAIHAGWAGNHRLWAERTHDGPPVLGAGELLLPGEMILAPGESYQSPAVAVSYGQGIDEVSARFHAFLRNTPQRATRPRPVTLNTWEAVYFDHDLGVLTELAERAQKIGIERFVLDDGWFGGRRADDAALGDWVVSDDVWPDGLQPLINVVHAHGMEFGLWVEPEMVSPNSDLAREHPDWILGEAGETPMLARHQQVLDLANPEAWRHVHDQLDAILDSYDIAYLKWDYNRDNHEPLDPASGRAKAREQVVAFNALVDQLKLDPPGLEIESCSSGGGRISLDVLERTDRVWVSDCIDPIERQTIQTWTSVLVSPELMGQHVGAPTSHTTGRTHDLTTRASTAMLGHFGVEWDLREADEDQLSELGEWIAIHKQLRPMIATGSLRHRETAARTTTTLISQDQKQAAVVIAQRVSQNRYAPELVRVPGLKPDVHYRVRVPQIGGRPLGTDLTLPEWMSDPAGVVIPGAALEHIGVAAPNMCPETSWLLLVDEEQPQQKVGER